MVGCWSSASIRRFIYRYVNVCRFDYTWLHGLVVNGKLKYPENRFNNTNWVAVVTPTDRPKSVRNQCIIEGFCGVFVLSIVCWIFCWYMGFRHITVSDLVLFLFASRENWLNLKRNETRPKFIDSQSFFFFIFTTRNFVANRGIYLKNHH